jgi:hypothetical protein
LDTIGTLNAMELLARVRRILNNGKRWTQKHVASCRLGFRCDPRSSRAHFFSLEGAASRAHWEMRDKVARTNSWEIRTVDVLHSLLAHHDTFPEKQSWTSVESSLLGVERALIEYEEALGERDVRKCA